MREFDNRVRRRKINSSTFNISVDGVDFAYTYIRKNACTSFKRLFKSYSEHDFKSAGGDLKGMAAYHIVKSAKEAEKIPYRVFVYRDPIERVVSVYNNKFVQCSGASDIFQDFYNITGMDPKECTFEDLVELYVANIKKGVMIDAHLLPQSWHLLPIVYNCVIKLPEIKKDMSSLLGKEVGGKFFSKSVNSTSNAGKFHLDNAKKIPAREIVGIYKSHNQLPSFESYVDDELRGSLESVYSDDFSMIESIE